MNRTLISLVVTALFAGAGNAALAQQGTESPTDASKSAYTAAQDKAQATYMNATAQCEAAPGPTTAVCLSDAQAARNKSLADAKATHEGRNPAAMTQDGSAQTTAHSGDGPTVDSGTDNGLLTAEERKDQPGQADSSADSAVVRSGSDPVAPQQGDTITGRNTTDSTGSTGDTPVVTSSNEEGGQGSSEPANEATTGQTSRRDNTSGRTSGNRAAAGASSAAAQAQYKQAMAKCDGAPGAERFTCREQAAQARRDAVPQASSDDTSEGRRSRTGRDDLSTNDDADYRNVSTAQRDTK
jgi:hypothetical protein